MEDDLIIYDKDDCPNCGSEEHIWKNSCDEIQCDNCGYSEGDEG